jgi:DNA-binding MarR family transcriptional regulator
MEPVGSILKQFKLPPLDPTKYDLLIRCAGKIGIKGTRFHLVAVLWRYANRHRCTVWPKNGTIAGIMGIHYRKVTENLSILITQGLIRRGKQWRTHRELDLTPLYLKLLEADGADPIEIPDQPECPSCHAKLSAKPPKKKTPKN